MSNSWPKIWGRNREIFSNDLCSLNILEVLKGGVCSYHNHKAKHNLFYVLSGKLKLHTELGDTILEPGQNFTILAGTKHNFEGLEQTKAIEIMYVQYDVNDIQRDTIGHLEVNGVLTESAALPTPFVKRYYTTEEGVDIFLHDEIENDFLTAAREGCENITINGNNYSLVKE